MNSFLIPILKADLGLTEVVQQCLFAGADHPNKMRFTGTLLQLDTASDQSPHGAEGHRILVPKSVCTTAKVRELVGMGLNYRSDLEGHDVRNKVGVITKAWLDGNAVKVKGIIWKKDFPEAVRDIKGRKLGMSMELANVRIRDKDEEVWHLEDLTFTGATTLWPRSAAYHKTALAASQAEGRETQMPTKDKEKVKTRRPDAGVISLADISSAFSTALGPVAKLLKKQGEALGTMQASIGSIVKRANEEHEDRELEEIVASGGKGGKEESASASLAASASVSASASASADVKAASKKVKVAKPDVEAAEAADSGTGSASDEDDDDDEDSMSAEASSVSASGSMESEAKPAKIAKVKVKAAKEKKEVPQVAAGASKKKYISALKASGATIATLQAENAKLEKRNRRKDEKMKTILAQNEAFADQLERQTIPGDLSFLLQKAGFDAMELKASGRKLSTGEVDEILAGLQLDTVDRMKYKNDLYAKGLMERGDINRNYQN